MFNLVVLSVLLAAATAAPQITNLPVLDGRIIGGDYVDIESFPYQLSLQLYDNHICGASLISPKFAITAAHCTSGSLPFQLTIRAGSSLYKSGGVVVNVKTIHQNPSYNPSTVDYDISIVELATELSFSDSIAPISLPAQDQAVEAGASCVVSGWGSLTEGGSLSSQLQAVEVAVISNAACAISYGDSITDRMMCAGVVEGGKDACQGDSGGPLVINGQLVGIISWGYGCARPYYPGVYTSVPALRSYITSTVGI